MIRVVAISNAYLEHFTRPGILDTGKYPEFELTAVVPRRLAKANPEGYSKLAGDCDRVITLSTFLNFHHSVRAYSGELLKVFKDIKPDIIFINNEPWSTTVFETVLLCKMSGLKSKIAVYTCENLRRKFVFPFPLFENIVLKNVDVVASLTRVEGPEILREKGYKGRIEYLPLGVDTTRFNKIAEDPNSPFKKQRNEGKMVFGFIGRLVPEKGITVVMRALKELGEGFHFVLIGRGPQKDELRRISSELRIDRQVTFIDGVPHGELPKYINGLDAVVLPSLTTSNWKEQFGRVLIEAMACEVPVIGSRSGEIPEVIGDGGVIFREGDVEDLQAKLVTLKDNAGERAIYGRNGRKRVCDKYDAAVIMAQTAKMYKDMVSNETSR